MQQEEPDLTTSAPDVDHHLERVDLTALTGSMGQRNEDLRLRQAALPNHPPHRDLRDRETVCFELPPNAGSDTLSNGFRTNRRGNGRLTLHVDFPIRSGAYPFQRFPDFENLAGDIALTNPTNLERLGGRDAAIRPVAITDGSQAEATILIASHCVDDTGHGLLPGPHENWFTWSVG